MSDRKPTPNDLIELLALAKQRTPPQIPPPPPPQKVPWLHGTSGPSSSSEPKNDVRPEQHISPTPPLHYLSSPLISDRSPPKSETDELAATTAPLLKDGLITLATDHQAPSTANFKAPSVIDPRLKPSPIAGKAPLLTPRKVPSVTTDHHLMPSPANNKATPTTVRKAPSWKDHLVMHSVEKHKLPSMDHLAPSSESELLRTLASKPMQPPPSMAPDQLASPPLPGRSTFHAATGAVDGNNNSDDQCKHVISETLRDVPSRACNQQFDSAPLAPNPLDSFRFVPRMGSIVITSGTITATSGTVTCVSSSIPGKMIQLDEAVQQEQKDFVDPGIPSQIKTLKLRCNTANCTFDTRTDDALSDHLWREHGIRWGRPYLCRGDGCDLAFVSPEQFTDHCKSHTATAFPCAVCNKQFGCSLFLSYHRHYCHVSGLFECLYQGCGFHADIRRKVGEHIKQAHLPALKRCPGDECNFRTESQKELVAHVKACHPDVQMVDADGEETDRSLRSILGCICM